MIELLTSYTFILVPVHQRLPPHLALAVTALRTLQPRPLRHDDAPTEDHLTPLHAVEDVAAGESVGDGERGTAAEWAGDRRWWSRWQDVPQSAGQ